MTDPQRVRKVFREIVHLEEDEAQRYLNQNYGDDLELIAAVLRYYQECDGPPAQVLPNLFLSTEGQEELMWPADIPFPRNGDLHGKYRFGERIGRGGGGLVWKGRDETLNRDVALKLLKPGTQFRKEAETLAKFNHANIVHVYEVNDWHGTELVAMELVQSADPDHRDMADFISEQAASDPKTIRQTVTWIAKISKVLHLAHQINVFHRDVKPSNILLAADGEPKLGDFGIATADATQDQHSENAGFVPGTRGYVAPELLTGAEPSALSDVYGLGVTLSVLLTGDQPDAVVNALNGNQGIPRDLREICVKAISLEPAERYQTAAELEADLQRFLQGEPVSARHYTSTERLSMWYRRNPRLASAIGAAALSLVVGTIVSTLFASDAYQQAQEKETQKRVAEDERNRAVVLQNIGELRRDAAIGVAIQQSVGRAQLYAENRDDSAALATYASAAQLAATHRQNRWVDQPITHPSGKDYQIADFLPDEELVQLKRDANELDDSRELLHHRRLAMQMQRTPQLQQVCFSKGAITSADISPDGRFIAIANSTKGTARVWDLDAGVPVSPVLRPQSPNPVFLAKLSPDAKILLLISRDAPSTSFVTLHSVPDGAVLVNEARISGAVWSAQFHPDGSRVVLASGRLGLFGASGTATVLNTDDLEPVVTVRHNDWVMSAAYDSTGDRVATATVGNVVQVWDAQSGDPLTDPMMMDRPMQFVTFSPDDKRLVCAGNFGKARVWDPATGKPITPMLSHGEVNNAVTGPGGIALTAACFSPNNQLVATACGDKTVRIWNANSGEALTAPLRHEDHVTACAFDRTGRYLLTSSLDGTTRVWDPATGLLVTSKLPHRGPVYGAAFVGDSQRIVSFSEDETARVWEFQQSAPTFPTSKTGKCIFTQCGRYVLESTESGQTTLYDASNSELLDLSIHATHDINHAVVSGSTLLLTTLHSAGKASLWHLETGEQIGVDIKSKGPITHACLSADGGYAAFAGTRALQVWDVRQRRLIIELDTEVGFPHAEFSSDEPLKLVVSGLDGSARIWDLREPTAAPLRLTHGLAVPMARFNHDGSLVITAGMNDAAEVWDSKTGEKIATLPHPDSVAGAVFQPGLKSEYILTWCDDRVARLWKNSGSNDQTVWTLQPVQISHTGEIRSAGFSPDGTMIATGDEKGLAQVHDVRTGSKISPDLVHSYAGVGLSPAVSQVSFTRDSNRLLAQTSLHTWVWETPREVPAPEKIIRSANWAAGRVSATTRAESTPTMYSINKHLQSWAEEHPEAYPVRLWLAELAEEQGKLETAAGHLRMAVETADGKKDGDLWYQYAELLQQQKNYEAAWRAVTQAFELDCKTPDTYALRGKVSLYRDDFQLAVEDFSEAIQGSAFNPWNPMFRGISYASLGEWEQAAKDYDRFFELLKQYMPIQPGHRYQRAILELAQGDEDNYRHMAQDLIEQVEQDPQENGHYLAAWLCAPCSNGLSPETWSEVLRLAEQAVSEDAGAPEKRLALGAVQLRNGQSKSANRSIVSALEQHAELLSDGKDSALCQPLAHIYAALTHLSLNQPAEAQRAFAIAQQKHERLAQLKAGEPRIERYAWHREVVYHHLVKEYKASEVK